MVLTLKSDYMKKLYLLLIFIAFVQAASAQLKDFSLGKVSKKDLLQEYYEADSSAHAFYIKESGEAYIDNEDKLLLHFFYHARVKVLDDRGTDAANIVIPVYQGKQGKEEVLGIEAVTYNLENGEIVRTELSRKNVYREDISPNVTLFKFTFPNVRPGSVLEYKYQLKSPYLFNYKSWEFQDKYPKQRSEYWARIPGNFIYNMRINGYLKLDEQDSKIMKDCFRGGRGGVAECVLYKFGMDTVPAFIEEKYMTAPRNFLSAIHFELSEIRYFDGRTDKITKTWEDVDEETRQKKNFGLAVKRGRKHFQGLVPDGAKDDLEKAKAIYYHLQDHFSWNKKDRAFCENDLDKAWQQRTGSSADINLTLVAALQEAGLDAHPALLSTRDKGYPVEIHPVISDFNYVVAYVKTKEKAWLLDATEKFLPFGMLPHKCLNVKVRVMDFDKSFWMDIPGEGKFREMTRLELDFQDSDRITGTYTCYKYGYDALRARNRIRSSGEDAYLQAFEKNAEGILVNEFEYNNLEDPEKPFVESYEIEFTDNPGASERIYWPAFPFDKMDENPFKLPERHYPVDFGAGWEIHNQVNITLPEGFEASSLPEDVAIALPASGGSFMMESTQYGRNINLGSKIVLSKPRYSPQEYPYLKEFFQQIVQAQAATIILEKK